MAKKVVISGYYGSDNFGDETILKVLVDKLKEEKVDITVLSLNPEKTKEDEWFNQAFKMPVQAASDDFLAGGIEFKLASVSKNMNARLFYR